MKKLLFIPLALFGLFASAQSSISVKDYDNGVFLGANAIVSKNTFISDNVKVTFDIKNVGATTQTYSVKRYDAVINTNGVDSADAYFCFGGLCYGVTTTVSPNPIVLRPGKSASDTSAAYFLLVTDLDEISTLGISVVKYTFFNVSNPNDTVQVSIRYNGPPIVNSVTAFGFGSVTASSGTVDPTPVVSPTGITFGSFSSTGNSANPVAANSFAFSGWPTGATDGNNTPSAMTGQINLNNYYSITVTPAPGYYVSLSSVDFNSDRSASGPRNYAVRPSTNTYATNLPASVITNSNLSVNGSSAFFWNFDATSNTAQAGNHVNLSASAFQSFASPVTFRFYSWNAEDAAGSFAIDNVVFNGYASLGITGIGEVSHALDAKFKVYPNPSMNGLVTLETAAGYSKIEIVNVTGATVLSQTNPSYDNKVTLNVAALETGVYFVKISSGDKFSTEKLMISK